MSTVVEQIVTPYHQTDRFSLYEGDSRSVLPIFADCSFDSIVCDPPYELGFMGKGWDRSGIAYDVGLWRECLRVLKPGGHLLAFGGSRTYHRLACAIEDAGFEIRDQIQYIYGSGFPKSLNVSKNLREEASVCTCNEHDDDLRGLQNGIPYMEGVAETGQNADVFTPVQRGATGPRMGQARLQGRDSSEPREPQGGSVARSAESGVERRGDLFSEARQLRADQICTLPARVLADGAEGRVRNGTPSDYGPMDRATANTNGSGSSRRSQSSEQPANKSAFTAQQSEPQTSGAWPICGRCGKPVVPEGLGSALKPAHEPIVLARKPFNTTLIQNVLQHGTGGLNIDGCRIETNETLSAGSRRLGDGVKFGFCEPTTEYEQNANGRWPSNICHDGSDEVLAAFPDAPGQQGDLSGHSKDRLSKGIFGDMKSAHDAVARLDSGSAARFFYCAKASRQDREEGLDDLRLRDTTETVNRDPRSAGVQSPRAGAGRGAAAPIFRCSACGLNLNSGERIASKCDVNGEHVKELVGYGERSRNHHPTVKPTELMKYLCRLITPPGGIVLDPFCGSGSTGKAAMLEGFKFVGIELNADYCQLAQRRIEAVTRQGLLFA